MALASDSTDREKLMIGNCIFIFMGQKILFCFAVWPVSTVHKENTEQFGGKNQMNIDI